MVRVSVILPTYRRPDFLFSAISSVLNQTFEDFELIVIDDASGDNTREIVRSFSDKRIRYICHETNKGEASARNTGLKSLDDENEFIAFLDDDDEWLPNKLKRQIELMEKLPLNVGCIYTGFYIVNSVTKKVINKKIPSKRGNIYKDLLINNVVGTPSTVLVRKECIEKTGLFDEKISYGVDYDFWIRISRYYHFEFIEEPLVIYHVHEGNMSKNPYVVSKGFDEVMKKHGIKLLYVDRDYYSEKYLSLGVMFLLSGDTNRGMKNLIKSLILNPYDIRTYIYIILSFGGKNLFIKMKKIIENRRRISWFR